MKAISLWQPWATLIAIGAKRIETRSWYTSHRGLLAIHAAKKDDAEIRALCKTEPFATALREQGHGCLPLGKIVCIARLANVIEIPREPQTRAGVLLPPAEPERSFGDYRVGRFAWIFDHVQALAEPIPFRGAQQLFDVPTELITSTPLQPRPACLFE